MQTRASRRRFCALATAGLVAPALPALAAPIAYDVDPARTKVGFGVQFRGNPFFGTMPVRSANLALDFIDIRQSRITVVIDASQIRMGIFFATNAVRGPALLDVARHPTMIFHGSLQPGATTREVIMTGDVTIKGITAPLTLRTQLSQDRSTIGQGNPPLTIQMNGVVDRRDFGLTAYPSLVGPNITLDIQSKIQPA